jgi:pyruvate,water dikinase
MNTPWIIEGNLDPRWPINTRGNVGEVFPEVVTMLGYQLGVIPAEKAWRGAYQTLGIMSPGDFSSDDPVIIGLYGGYVYLNLSYLRMMGVRAPGSSAEAIDVAFFGEGNPPPYQPRKGDKSIGSSLRILKTVLGALGTKKLPPIVADSFSRAEAYAALRPSLDAPDQELLDYLLTFPAAFLPAFGNHMQSTAIASIVSGVLIDACAAAGEPGLATHLLGASGEVHSAQYSHDLYRIAQSVRQQPTVNAAFGQGVEGLLDRLAGQPDAEDFLAQFAQFVENHGHRGPNDWELSSRTWENTPELALVALDRMRVADHDLSPDSRLADDDTRRQEAAAKVRPHLNFMDKMNFDKALKASPFWSQAREATRDRAVRINLPAKQVYRELVRRAAERGGNPDPVRVALLNPYTELAGYIKNPGAFTKIIEERGALFDRFSAVTPPFFLSSQEEVPSLEELEATQAALTAVPQAKTGDVLTGNAGSQGVARGRARIVMDPADAFDLEPGEVLVAPLTDPAWTPLFLPAAAVVVNVGALLSHAIIVSRELAIPCVVALEGATDIIPNGALVEVDGTAGTVTIIEE